MQELEKHLSVTQRGESEPLKAKRIMERIRYLTKEIQMTGKKSPEFGNIEERRTSYEEIDDFRFGLTTLLLASCGSPSDNDSMSETTKNDESTTNSTVESEATTIFTGVLQENATAGDNETIQIFLNDIEAVDDQENDCS